MGKFQGICPRVAPRASEHRRFKLMSRCESINLSTKPYFVGQKAFSMVAKDKKKEKQFHVSPLSRRMRPRVRVKRENCYHYLGEAKKVRSRKKIFIRGNNQDGYFIPPHPAGYLCYLVLLKLIVPIIFQGETLRKKEVRRALLLCQHISKTLWTQLSGNFNWCQELFLNYYYFRVRHFLSFFFKFKLQQTLIDLITVVHSSFFHFQF